MLEPLTVHIAMALRNLMQKGSTIKPRLVTVDIQDVNHEITGYWKKYGLIMSPEGMIQAAGCQDIVTFYKIVRSVFGPQHGKI